MSQEGIERVLGELREFVREREWEQFHSPENLAKSVSIEAGELLECFQWGQPKDVSGVRHELADVLTYCLLLADRLGMDPLEVVIEKLEITRAKYPVELSRGRSTKHDQP
ncbi:nucleotide pyrophosphohydrolase [Sinomonas sp. P10A9]|uniref:Nucleotide pyrophosphohydrolase n=1 Tax=Sinomonas puerhi TaxID=3238584 RepID=A0AB39L5K3_9MICC